MTKPAAVFMQLLGVVLIVFGFGAAADGGSTWMIWVGLGLLVWGGISIRKRIERDQQVTRRDDDRP